MCTCIYVNSVHRRVMESGFPSFRRRRSAPISARLPADSPVSDFRAAKS